MPITVTRTTTFAPSGDQDGDTFVDFGDVLRHTLVISNSGTGATGVVVNDPLNGSTLTGPVNVSPLAFDDSFSAVGNTLLEVGNATAQTGPQTSFAGSVISNDVEFLGDTFSISALQATAVAGSTVSATSANGGAVTMVATGADAGAFTYVSAAGFTGTDTFTYTIRDKGLDGIAGNADDLTSTATVTITVANKVWYVDSTAGGGGTGTSTNPFNSFTQLNGVTDDGSTNDDVDGANDIIHVRGATTGAGLVLENGQQLVGTGTALVVGAQTLFAASTNSSMSDATGYTLTLGSGNTITGLNILNTAAAGGSSGALTGSNFGTLTVSGVAIDGGNSQALILNTGAIAGTGFTSTDSDGGSNNVSLTSVTGGLNLGSGALSGASSNAVVINGGNGSFDYDGTVSHAANAVAINVSNKTGGTVDFDGAVTSNGNSDGVFLNSNTGATINFDGGVVIDTSASNTTAFTATGGGTISVTDTGAGMNTTISSGTGTGLSLSGVTVGNGAGGSSNGITFDSISNSGAGTGVSISTVGQGAGSSGIDINGGTIANANVRGVDIDATSADVSVASTISNAGGRTVEVTNSGRVGGSTIAFSGAIDENGTGINLDNNDQNTNGATITFSGGLDIDSASGNFGFNAINGGTVNVTGTNTIDTANGIGLNVTGTTIGGSGLTFQHISVNGGANGIVLNGTGAGGLTVTGDAGSAVNASGGTIQNTSGVGILLTNANNINLDQMTVQNGGNDGINGTTVNNFSLTNSTVSGNGNGNDENGIEFTGLTGAATISNDTIHNSFEDNFRLTNTSGTLDSLNIKNSVFDQTSILTTGGNGVIVDLQGTAVVTDLSISGSTFRNNYSNGILVNTGNTSRIGLDNATNASTHGSVVSGNTFDDNNIAIQFGVFNNSDQTVDIQNNTIVNDGRVATSGTNSSSHAIVVGSSALAGTGSTLNARIEGNVIGNAGIAGSGSSIGDGMRVIVQGLTDGTILINNNTIRQTPDGFGIEATFLGPQDDAGVVPTSDVTITNNTVLHANAGFNPGTSDFPLEAIYVAGDNQGGAPGAPTVHAQISGNTVPASVAGFGFVGQFANDWIAAYEYSGASPGNLSLVDTGAASGSAIAELQQANGNNANVYSEANVSLIGGPLNLPPDLTPLPLQVVAPPAPPAETPPAGSGDPTPPADQPDPTPPAPSGEPGPVVVDDGVLSAGELALIVDAAIDRWAAAGATDAQIAEMRAVTVSVENLAGLNIGLSYDGRIVVDDNAGGYNWFVDSTPGDDSEYAGSGTQLVAPGHTLAGDRVDLLTTVMHELGHQIGLTDIYAPGGAAELMYGTIFIGERRLPGGDDAAAGDGIAATGSALALTPVSIGNIPIGKSITMQWDSTLDSFGPGLAPTYTNFSTVTGSNPGGFSVNSNTETLSTSSALALDSLTLGGTVWTDNGNGGGIAGNGIQDGAEPTVNGVALTLFVDSNLSGAWDAGDVQVATTTTAGGGLYSFSGLGPGDYIVRVDQANFNAGGALLATQASSLTVPEPIDPDNNADNDDNGARAAGQPAYSGAITLAFDSEPNIDGSGKFDLNNTLDFGFTVLNTAPTSTSLSGDTATFTEGDAPVAVDVAGNATISDTTSADFGGGSLTIAITAGGVAAEDVLTLAAAGTITFDATTVSSGGVQFATYTGGSGGNPLVFTFDPDATPAAVQALVHAIRYTNTGGDNPTDGDRTLTWTLVDGDGTSSGGADTLTVSTTVNVDPVADAPVAQPDAVSTAENVTLTGGAGALFANNGSGADNDVDGPALSISAVNGVGANVGTQITLASGALLTVNADGSYNYDPNGKFNYLISAATAATTFAVNDTATDSFTYALAGGNTVTVTVTVNGVAGVGDQLWGDSGNNTINGTPAGILFNLSQGGNDTATGQGGNDGFYMGAALNALDNIDGGAGFLDQLGLQGNYGSPYVLSATNLVNIEGLVLLPGNDTRFGDTAGNFYSYNIATVDANVGSGQLLVVNFNTLRVGENVTFDGSAESNGSFLTFGGLGNDTITGGAQADGFFFGNNGRWGAGDSVTGGGGSDQLGLQGDYNLTFGATQLSGIETIVLLTGGDVRFGNPAGFGYSYDLTMNDGNVAATETMIINANTLRAGVVAVTDETLTFNGSAELDGHFTIYSGAADDTIIGGAQSDRIYGAGGADTMTGGGGNDTFAYMNAAHSTAAAMDQILDFTSGDQIDLSAIDAVTGGANDAFSFIDSSAFSNTAGELRVVDVGGGVWQVQGDIDGNGVADLVIAVTTAQPLVVTDFVL